VFNALRLRPPPPSLNATRAPSEKNKAASTLAALQWSRYRSANSRTWNDLWFCHQSENLRAHQRLSYKNKSKTRPRSQSCTTQPRKTTPPPSCKRLTQRSRSPASGANPPNFFNSTKCRRRWPQKSTWCTPSCSSCALQPAQRNANAN
jgi:hypothetical protein